MAMAVSQDMGSKQWKEAFGLWKFTGAVGCLTKAWNSCHVNHEASVFLELSGAVL